MESLGEYNRMAGISETSRFGSARSLRRVDSESVPLALVQESVTEGSRVAPSADDLFVHDVRSELGDSFPRGSDEGRLVLEDLWAKLDEFSRAEYFERAGAGGSRRSSEDEGEEDEDEDEDEMGDETSGSVAEALPAVPSREATVKASSRSLLRTPIAKSRNPMTVFSGPRGGRVPCRVGACVG